MFDPYFAIFDIPVHEATHYIALVCVILKVCSLIGGFLRGCIKKDICEIFCGPIISAICIIPSALLWYGNAHNIPWMYWPWLIFSVLFVIISVPWAIFTLCCQIIFLPCACCVCLVETFGVNRRYNIAEANRMNEQGGVAPEDQNVGLKSIILTILSTISLFLLVVYAYAITVVNRDHNLLLKG